MSDRPDEHTRRMFVPVPGAHLGTYVILEPIGAGGMGEVYLAEDQNLGRKAALKFLPLHLAGNPEFRARFLREARAAAALNHPNIVHIYEVGEFEGRPFIAMEHVDGRPLRDHIPAEGMNPLSALHMILPLAEALAEAHAAGIVHRDLKPSNVVLDRAGRPKLLDFGLASLAGGERVTQVGSTLGTVGYMAPEQVRGQEADPRADLFSLGVLFYELLAGHPPFRGENEAATLHALLHAEPEPLTRFRPEVSPALATTVTRLLAKEPAGRYASARELCTDLAQELRHLEGSGIASATVAASSPPSASRGKRLRILVPPAVAAVALIALVITHPWSRNRAVVPEAQAGENRLVILYFENVADPSDPGRLGEIAPSLLITDLSDSQYLQVVSTQRLYDILKNMGHEGAKRIEPGMASEVAQKAGAKWMLTGKILQGDPEIVLTAELVEMSTGNLVASQRISGKPGEKIFAVVDRLSASLREDLSLPAAARTEPDRPVAEATTQNPEAYRLYLEGVESYAKIYLEEARAKFEQATALDTTFALPYVFLSIMTQDWQGRREYAEKAARHAGGLGWRDKARVDAQLREARGDVDGAITTLRRIVERDPEDKEVWFYLGLFYFNSGRQADAVTAFRRAVAVDPSFKSAYNTMAYAYDALGDVENSLWAINEYIRLVPDEPNPYDSRGDLYAAGGRLQEAAASYGKALEMNPDFYLSRAKLVDAYIVLGDEARAHETLRPLESDPRPEAKAQLDWCRALASGYHGHLGEYARLLLAGAEDDRDPAREETATKFGVAAIVLASLGRTDEAVRVIERGSRVAGPDDPGLVGPSAIVLSSLGRWQEAESKTERFAARMGSRGGFLLSSLWSARGEIALARGDSAAALSAFEKAHEASPDFYAKARLGRAYLDAGEPELAVNVLEKAAVRYDDTRRFMPFGVLVTYDLARAYEATGRTADALAQYRKFLGIWADADPGLRWVEDAKARVAWLAARS